MCCVSSWGKYITNKQAAGVPWAKKYIFLLFVFGLGFRQQDCLVSFNESMTWIRYLLHTLHCIQNTQTNNFLSCSQVEIVWHVYKILPVLLNNLLCKGTSAAQFVKHFSHLTFYSFYCSLLLSHIRYLAILFSSPFVCFALWISSGLGLYFVFIFIYMACIITSCSNLNNFLPSSSMTSLTMIFCTIHSVVTRE